MADDTSSPYEIVDLLGSGIYASVSLAINREYGQEVALKRYNENGDFVMNTRSILFNKSYFTYSVYTI